MLLSVFFRVFRVFILLTIHVDANTVSLGNAEVSVHGLAAKRGIEIITGQQRYPEGVPKSELAGVNDGRIVAVRPAADRPILPAVWDVGPVGCAIYNIFADVRVERVDDGVVGIDHNAIFLPQQRRWWIPWGVIQSGVWCITFEKIRGVGNIFGPGNGKSACVSFSFLFIFLSYFFSWELRRSFPPRFVISCHIFLF